VALVLDEHEESLQEERTPTWHARDVLIERARRSDAVFIAVSAVPTPVVRHGRTTLAPPPERESAAWPEVVVVDRSAVEPWKRSLLSDDLIAELRDHSRRVACVINTKGHARVLACRSCRQLARCGSCGAAVAEVDEGSLTCPACAQRTPRLCSSCGATALARVRPGTARLRSELEAASHRSVVEITGSTAVDFDDTRTDVFVGTEAVLHRTRRIDVVAFLDADAELLAPRHRAAEEALALVVRAGRLVGPRGRGGRVIVQTSLPDHVALRAAVSGVPDEFCAAETERRRVLGFAPFAALATISGEEAEVLARRLETLVEVAPHDGSWLVRAADPDALAAAVASVERPTRVRIEVDPPRI
jgi:primosomal protein N' (replication factor Y)